MNYLAIALLALILGTLAGCSDGGLKTAASPTGNALQPQPLVFLQQGAVPPGAPPVLARDLPVGLFTEVPGINLGLQAQEITWTRDGAPVEPEIVTVTEAGECYALHAPSRYRVTARLLVGEEVWVYTGECVVE